MFNMKEIIVYGHGRQHVETTIESPIREYDGLGVEM